MTKGEKKNINKLLREYIVKRDGEKCLRCGRTDTLAMSHIYPKGRHRSMEYDVDNIKFLCFSCHLCWWHKSPIEAWEWLRETLPKKRLERLKLMANTTNKVPEYKLLKLWLEKELSK
jgi:5-methylcytosine-specific restriction endonuclease McrA